jgi:hypothetical protein
MSEEKEEKKYYCFLDSNGADTNLQLYSLKKAYEEWISLTEDYKYAGERLGYLKERLVFVISCIGLSLSQLLGQNAVIIKQKLDIPDALLAAFLNESKYDRTKKNLLNRKFGDFIRYYDACRHFGKVEDDKQWKLLNSIDYNMVEKFMDTALDIWNAIIGHYRSREIDAENIKDILEGYY